MIGGASILAGVAVGKILSDSPNQEGLRYKEFVKYTFEGDNELTREDFINQFDLIYNDGLKRTIHKSKEFPNGTSDEGSVWYTRDEGGHISLNRGFTTTEYPSGKSLEIPVKYRLIKIQTPSSVTVPTLPGITEKMTNLNLELRDNEDSTKLFVATFQWDKEGDPISDHSTYDLSRKDLATIARQITFSYNLAVSNGKLL